MTRKFTVAETDKNLSPLETLESQGFPFVQDDLVKSSFLRKSRIQLM
jgi:hypothetical protein